MPRYHSRFWSIKMIIRNRTIQPNKLKKKHLLSIALSSTILSQGVLAEDDSMWDMSLEDLGTIRVTTLATGTATPLDKAAAVATVITEEDIIAMGATDVDEILETVPGLHVGTSDQTFAGKYNIRGITSAFNAQTLMLINGIPITELVFGNRGNVWAGMPVKSIARIEVIRGPGSAMYGADAFAGVINIITKARKDINGTIGGVRAGSFGTQAGWVEHGESYNDFDVAFTLEYETSDGSQEPIAADAFGNSGTVNRMTDMIETRLDISHKNSHLRIGFQDRDNIGLGVGVLPLLDPKGRFSSQRFNADYTYTQKNLTPDLSIEGRASYYRGTQKVEEDINLAPAAPAIGFGPAFANGFIGNPGFEEENARLDLSGIYKGINKHIFRIGTGFFWGDVFKTTESKNFNPDNSPRAGGIEDVSDTAEVWLPETDRTNYHLFAQDEWQLADNWQLTTGIRYDHYSDFGDTTNPRLALVWATTDAITTKFLYGRAFRAPSISELFVTSNPVNLGDPDLEPETIDTYELAFSHQVSSQLNYTANTYYYQIDDLITLIPVGTNKQWQNTSDRTGYGVEFEVDYQPNRNIRLLANYAYQKSEDDASNKNVGDAPNQQVYARAEWKAGDKWLITPQLNWVGSQQRVPEDTLRTEDVKHYTTVNLTIKQMNIIPDLDFSLNLRNLFDRRVIEPSPISPIGGIASDFPMDGRNIYGELSYTF
jgi:outer membrane receptor for ferrienterochelin and colicin